VVWFLDETDARLLLIPHVHAPQGHYESDLEASRALLAGLPARCARAAAERVVIVTQELNACELKWLIAQTGWFCGARMHSTIAGLSSGVATAALAYSMKTRGVFASCSMSDAVVDLREATGPAALASLQQLWHRRERDASNLAGHLPRVRALAARQLDEIVDCVRGDQLTGEVLPC